MLKVLKSGFYSTIQDAGRFGYRTYGVPVSGVMDRYSSQFANALLGNRENDAVLEMTMVGGEFQFLKPTIITISGANMKPKLNQSVINYNTPTVVKANDILTFSSAANGLRAYLAIKGGFRSNDVLESRSQYMPITKTNKIFNDEVISYKTYNNECKSQNAVVRYDDLILDSNIIEVFRGPEFNKLSVNQKEQLLNNEFKVSKFNNRMAYQLEPLLKNDLESILTSPVLPGTVQLTPKGNLIVLMRDCQTTGGYPRVLQLTETAINILSQKKTGNTINVRLKD